MSLLSSLRKNKQEAPAEDSTFYSRAEEESKAVRRRSKRQDSKDNEPADPVLPEKKRARRRLIGAVALVLAAVIGLPMMFDSEPKPVADDIAIQIPSKDKAPAQAAARPAASLPSKIAASASLDPMEEVVDATAVAPADSKAQEADQGKAAPLAAAATTAAVVAAAPLAKDKEEAAKPSTETAQAKHEAKPEQKSEAKPESKPEAKPADKKPDDARAKALLEGKPDPAKTPDKKPGKFVIQVAALATKEKIDEVQGKLKAGGIKSYTEKVATQSGDRTRIRVGPFANKEEADKVQAKIHKLGLTNAKLVPA